MAGEHQTHDYYMTIGPMFSDSVARQLYAEIASIEEQHVTQYESIIDPDETWLEKWVLHEANELYNYYSCYQQESNPRLKVIWERMCSYELGHLHYVIVFIKTSSAAILWKFYLVLCLTPLIIRVTVMTPAADMAAVTSDGVMKVITDPRSSLSESLQALLVAELTDNDGWQMLIQLAQSLGQDKLVSSFQQALAEEDEHLAFVRRWLSAEVEQDAHRVPKTSTH